MKSQYATLAVTLLSLMSCSPYDGEPYDEEAQEETAETEAPAPAGIEGTAQALAPNYVFISQQTRLCMEVEPFAGAFATQKPCTLSSKQKFVPVLLRKPPYSPTYALRHEASGLCLASIFNSASWMNVPGLAACNDNFEWVFNPYDSTQLRYLPTGKCAFVTGNVIQMTGCGSWVFLEQSWWPFF